MRFKIFDFVNKKGVNEFKKWSENLQKPQRAKLNEKIDKLAFYGDELMPQLLTDSGENGIKKLRITVHNVQLRPLLCNGPINNETEYTFLVGAKEIGDEWAPKDARKTARNNMDEIIANPEERRIEHE